MWCIIPIHPGYSYLNHMTGYMIPYRNIGANWKGDKSKDSDGTHHYIIISNKADALSAIIMRYLYAHTDL